MPKRARPLLVSSLALAALLLVVAAGPYAWARMQSATASSGVRFSATSATPHVTSLGALDMGKVPQASAKAASRHSNHRPFLTPLGTQRYQQAQRTNRGSAAPHNDGYASSPAGAANAGTSTAGGYWPSVFNAFNGADNASKNGFTLEPPDMALAAGQNGFELQGVNDVFALYNVTGTLQAGWPKTAAAFFNVPAPQPAGCDGGSGPFLSDPRAFYDSADGHYAAAMLEVEGAFGVNPSCTFKSVYYVAVSATNNPAGTWWVYAIDMRLGTTNAADYTQLGFNGDGIYVSANMFNQAGTQAQYAEVVGCAKADYYAHAASPRCNSYSNLTVAGSGGTVHVDTVNPAETQASDWSTHAEFFVSAFNGPDPAGNDCVTTACHGVMVYAWSDPGNTTGSGNHFSGVFVDTASYLEPPAADEPGCSACIESLDTRISATPVFHAGYLYAAHATGITNSSAHFVPGIQWFEFKPTLPAGYPANTAGASAVKIQDAYFNGSGDTATTFPALMVNNVGDMVMMYDYMSGTINPGVNYTSRRVTDPPNTIQGIGRVLKAGAAVYSGPFGPCAATASGPSCRYGDFSAASYDGMYNDNIWIAGQYAAANGDWATWIARLHPLIGDN